MDVSIQRSTVFALVVVGAAGGYLWLRGGRAALPALPGPPAVPVAPVAPAAPPPPDQAPVPVLPDPTAPAAPSTVTRTPEVEAPAAGGAPVRRERTPDEKARSLIAVAEGYAENGRYDLAFEKLEAAQALGPTDAVQEEIRRSTDAVTARMRAARH